MRDLITYIAIIFVGMLLAAINQAVTGDTSPTAFDFMASAALYIAIKANSRKGGA